MTIIKNSDTRWSHEFAGSGGWSDDHDIEATPEGLEIHGDVIPWSELDSARGKLFPPFIASLRADFPDFADAILWIEGRLRALEKSQESHAELPPLTNQQMRDLLEAMPAAKTPRTGEVSPVWTVEDGKP